MLDRLGREEQLREIHRPRYRMSFRSQFLTTIALLLILGVALLTFLGQEQQSSPALPASINRDCAPWDGPAFTVSIPMEGSVISISVYHSPEIRFPITYSFPDETMREGNALLLLRTSRPEPLSGRVSFSRLEQGTTVEGKFKFATDTGQRYDGTFIATWGNEIVYCG